MKTLYSITILLLISFMGFQGCSCQGRVKSQPTNQVDTVVIYKQVPSSSPVLMKVEGVSVVPNTSHVQLKFDNQTSEGNHRFLILVEYSKESLLFDESFDINNKVDIYQTHIDNYDIKKITIYSDRPRTNFN